MPAHHYSRDENTVNRPGFGILLEAVSRWVFIERHLMGASRREANMLETTPGFGVK
jgi:hypothetical protein